jgi:hypothetical protein
MWHSSGKNSNKLKWPYISEEIKSELNSKYVHSHPVQILSLFCRLKTQFKLYETIIFSQSYGCVTWFLTLGYFKTECWGKFWTSEGGNNRGWKKLHNEEHHYLYSSSGVTKIVKSRSMSLLEHVGWKRGEMDMWNCQKT